MSDVCSNCGAVRKRWRQWFRRDDTVLCPACAPEDWHAERSAKKREAGKKRTPDPAAREIADRAAKLVIEDGLSRRDVMERTGVGWKSLCSAIKRLRDERAAREQQTGGSP